VTRKLDIDVYFDLVCPWCLIGKRHLASALAEFASVPGNPPVQVHWHSVQLFPDLPPDGLDYRAFYAQRLGSVEAVQVRQAQVRAAASSAGTEVHFDRIRRFPNTQLAHQMLAFGKAHLSPEMLDALLEALLAGYFQNGADIGDPDALLAIGSRHGVAAAPWHAWLAAGRTLPSPRVPSVPFLVFDHAISLAGAQPVNVMLEAMREALAAEGTPTH
jgi:predicted DsbA family dithiol-disulfide isomerase